MKLKWEWILLRLFYIISSVSLLLMLCPFVSEAFDVIYAVNCGGQKHTDRYGVRYATDSNKVGISSDFGKSLSISRVHPEDMILYQTERYHTTSFSYDIPIEVEGEFILITKFAEVYFTHPNGKVFDIVLNKRHKVVSSLDIFAKVGKAIAHDEVTRFTIENGQLLVGDQVSDFDGVLTVEFSKGQADNPKVNAIVLIRGPAADAEIPALPAPEIAKEQTDDYVSDWDDENPKERKFKKTSGPKLQDPYASDDSWFMPITIAIAVFLPVLFCLCRVR